MAAPGKYTPSFSFSGYQATQPDRPLPGPRHDTEYFNIAYSLGQTIDALNDIRRDDGHLENGIVDWESLDPALGASLFPDAPSDNLIYGRLNATWTPVIPVGIGDTLPGTARAGELFWENDSGNLFVRYQDADSAQWVQVNMTAPSVPDASNPAIYDTRAELATTLVPTSAGALRTNGYAIPGDGGGALYKRVGTEPAHAGKVESLGAWWELAETAPDIRMFGADPTGVADSCAALQAAIDFLYAHRTEPYGHPAYGSGTIRIGKGKYSLNAAPISIKSNHGRGLVIEGDGETATALETTNVSGVLFDIDTYYRITFQFLSIIHSGGPPKAEAACAFGIYPGWSNTCFQLDSSSSGTAFHLYRVHTFGFNKVIDQVVGNGLNGDDLQGESCSFRDFNLFLYSESSQAVNCNFTRCAFGGRGKAGKMFEIGGMGHLAIRDCDITINSTILNLRSFSGKYGSGSVYTIENCKAEWGPSYEYTHVSLPYDAETSNFALGETVTGGTSLATGVIAQITDAGTTGTLVVRSVTGTFVDNEAITSPTGAAVANIPTGVTTFYPPAAVLHVDGPNVFGRVALLNTGISGGVVGTVPATSLWGRLRSGTCSVYARCGGLEGTFEMVCQSNATGEAQGVVVFEEMLRIADPSKVLFTGDVAPNVPLPIIYRGNCLSTTNIRIPDMTFARNHANVPEPKRTYVFGRQLSSQALLRTGSVNPHLWEQQFFGMKHLIEKARVHVTARSGAGAKSISLYKDAARTLLVGTATIPTGSFTGDEFIDIPVPANTVTTEGLFISMSSADLTSQSGHVIIETIAIGG